MRPEPDSKADRPRIAIDYRPALLGSSGIPRAVRELVRALAARNTVDLRLFGHSWSRPAGPAAPPAGSTLHRLRIPGRLLPACARLGLGAERLSGGAALMHWTDYVLPPVGRQVPVVWTLHDAAFAIDPRWHGASGSATLQARSREAVARATRIVCPTTATAEAAVEHLGARDEQLRVIPFGADHTLPPADASLVPDGPFLLQVGTLEPRKNHLRALAAWRRLGPNRPPLVVVGKPGWECTEIVAALRDATASEPLHWHDRATDAQLRGLLEAATCLVYPSLLEGFGFPPLEALALGTPVLAGDTPALREVLGPSARGSHVPAVRFADPLDVDALHDALSTLLNAAPAHGDAPRATSPADLPRWADCAAAHERLYREVLDG